MKLVRVIQAVLVIALALTALLGPAPQAAAQAAPSEAVAALVIIDVSGSNRTTDPGNLRFTDARLFASLLDDGDAFGAIAFATQSQRLTNGLVVIGSPADKRALIQSLGAVTPDGYTDFKAAFIEAQDMLGGANLQGRKPVVICLTDGQPEIAAPYATYEDEALAEAKKLGVPVMSIALTDAALTPFLSRLARETNGAVIPASQAEDLLDAYLAVFSQIKDRTVVGSGATAAPGSADLALDPALMPYLESASFVLSNTAGVQGAFVGPDGLPVREGAGGVAFLMRDDPLFSVVTVNQPAGGKWAFRLSGSGEVQARAIIRSRLRVEAAAPGRLHEAGQPMPVTVRLVEEKTDGRIIKIIGEASFSALITRPDGKQESLDRFYDDGTHGDVQGGDGDYTRLYVNADQPGAYSITVRGNKGQVPVERTVRVQAVNFPTLQTDGQDGMHFDVRGQPVTIAARLAGSGQDQFDGGELHATVRPPTGQPSELVLKWDGQRYAANYLPQEDGSYQVELVPDRATYQGLPYGHTAQASFTARIVPAIAIGARTIDLGEAEVLAARRGLTLTLPVTSTSRQAEMLTARLDGLAGWRIADGSSMVVPAGGTSNLVLHLQASDQVAVGPIEGQLALAGPAGLDLAGGPVRITGTLYEPSVQIQPVPLDLGSPASCTGWNAALKVRVEVQGKQVEEVNLQLTGLSGMSLEPVKILAQPGSTEVLLRLTPGEDPQPGEYAGTLHLAGRPGLKILTPDVPVTFSVAPLLQRCRGKFAVGGVLLVGLVGMTLVVGKRVRSAHKPALVAGTLRHWPAGRPTEATEIDLTAKRGHELTLGRGEKCDVVIGDPTLADEHAVLQAEKTPDGVRVTVRPVGEIKRGYRTVAEPFALSHRDTFRMGNREYQYLTDEGV